MPTTEDLIDAGALGVDGQAVVEAEDIEAVERGKAMDELVRNRAYLGREFLSWVLYRSNETTPIAVLDDEPITALLVGKTTLRGLAGEATEVAAKGQMSAYSAVVRASIERGLLVHAARLRLLHGEHAFEVTLDAEHLDHRSAELPALLSEEADDKITERMWLVEKLCRLIDALWDRFVELRFGARWDAEEVPGLLAWLAEPREQLSEQG